MRVRACVCRLVNVCVCVLARGKERERELTKFKAAVKKV